MKTWFPWICFFFFLHKTGDAQSYIPFPTDSATWCIGYGEGFIDWSYSFGGVYAYEIAGDTLIDGEMYKNLSVSRNFYHYENYATNTFGYYYTDYTIGLVGALREEDKKIYFYRYDSAAYALPGEYQIPENVKTLLYDFNLSLGDTALFTLSYVVIAEDSILCEDGTYHRSLFLENDYGYSTYWVEGIGDVENGLFGPYILEFEGFEWSFIGYAHNDLVVYAFADCEEGGFDNISESMNIQIKINTLVTSDLNIHSGIRLDDCEIKVIDLLGREVIQKKLTGNQSKIPFNEVADGFYVVAIYKENRLLFSEKICVANY